MLKLININGIKLALQQIADSPKDGALPYGLIDRHVEALLCIDADEAASLPKKTLREYSAVLTQALGIDAIIKQGPISVVMTSSGTTIPKTNPYELIATDGLSQYVFLYIQVWILFLHASNVWSEQKEFTQEQICNYEFMIDEIQVAVNAFRILNAHKKAYTIGSYEAFVNEVATLFFNSMPDAEPGDTVILPCGSPKHAMYLVIRVLEDTLVLSIDNLGLGFMRHPESALIQGAKSSHGRPYIFGIVNKRDTAHQEAFVKLIVQIVPCYYQVGEDSRIIDKIYDNVEDFVSHNKSDPAICASYQVDYKARAVQGGVTSTHCVSYNYDSGYHQRILEFNQRCELFRTTTHGTSLDAVSLVARGEASIVRASTVAAMIPSMGATEDLIVQIARARLNRHPFRFISTRTADVAHAAIASAVASQPIHIAAGGMSVMFSQEVQSHLYRLGAALMAALTFLQNNRIAAANNNYISVQRYARTLDFPIRERDSFLTIDAFRDYLQMLSTELSNNYSEEQMHYLKLGSQVTRYYIMRCSSETVRQKNGEKCTKMLRACLNIFDVEPAKIKKVFEILDVASEEMAQEVIGTVLRCLRSIMPAATDMAVGSGHVTASDAGRTLVHRPAGTATIRIGQAVATGASGLALRPYSDAEPRRDLSSIAELCQAASAGGNEIDVRVDGAEASGDRGVAIAGPMTLELIAAATRHGVFATHPDRLPATSADAQPKTGRPASPKP